MSYFNGKRLAYFAPSTGNQHYYWQDHLGSASVMSNSDGSTIEWEADYYPFGSPRVINNFLDNYFRFADYQWDPEMSYYYLEHREQSPNLGRFFSPDASFADQHPTDSQSWNLYAYVRNNPVAFDDPTGNECITLQGVSGPVVADDGQGHPCEFMTSSSRPDAQVYSDPDAARIQELADDISGFSSSTSISELGINAFMWSGLVEGAAGAAKGISNYLESFSLSQAKSLGIRALLPTFANTTVDEVVASSRQLTKGGQISQGARAISKKLGHAASGGFTSAFDGMTGTQEEAEAAIRSIMNNPTRVDHLAKYIDVYNAAGQGIRIEQGTNRFVGFLELSKATP